LRTKLALVGGGLGLLLLLEAGYSMAMAPYVLPGQPSAFPNGPFAAIARELLRMAGS
jgi:hypothetical protein